MAVDTASPSVFDAGLPTIEYDVLTATKRPGSNIDSLGGCLR
jgi:hypothetical protein